MNAVKWWCRRVVLCAVVLCQVVPLQALANTRGESGNGEGCDAAAYGSFRCQQDNQSESGDLQKHFQAQMRVLDSDRASLSVVYQVHVVGAVRYPGTYEVRASDRLQSVLQQVGGISDNGSRRRINVRSSDKKARVYDLLQFQLHGQLRHNPHLRDGDVVHIPLRKDVIEIVGAVRRPDEYELRKKRRLSDVVALAGGFTSGVMTTRPIKVIRYRNSEREVLSVEHSDRALKKFMLQAGDLVVVHDVVTARNTFDYNSVKLPGGRPFYPSYEDRVFVLGGVESPGAYDFNPFYSAEQYISVAGGMTPLAHRRKVQIIGTNGEKTKYKLGTPGEMQINPGDTVFVKESRVAPETWARIVLGLASTALGITTSVIALSRL